MYTHDLDDEWGIGILEQARRAPPVQYSTYDEQEMIDVLDADTEEEFLTHAKQAWLKKQGEAR